jgi:hypothetical protein
MKYKIESNNKINFVFEDLIQHIATVKTGENKKIKPILHHHSRFQVRLYLFSAYRLC